MVAVIGKLKHTLILLLKRQISSELPPCHMVTSLRVTLLHLAWVPFIEDLLEALTSGLVAGNHDSEGHA